MASSPPTPNREAMIQNEIRLSQTLGPLPSHIEELNLQAPTRDGHHHNDILILRPKPPTTKPSPLIIFFHGGSYTAGCRYQVIRPARELVTAFDAVVVCPEYRLAPEYRFPVPVQDCWDVVVWAAKHAESDLGASPKDGFVLAGFSAGGNAAAVCSYVSKTEEGEEMLKWPVTGVLVSIPSFFLSEEVVPERYRGGWTSREDNRYSTPINTEDCEKGMEVYRPDQRSVWCCPMNGERKIVEKLPRTLVQVADLDPLRDDGVVYKRFLEDAGVETRLDTFTNVGHMCFSVYAGEDHPNFEEMKESTMKGLTWLLRKDE